MDPVGQAGFLARTPLPGLAHRLRIGWLRWRRPLALGVRAIVLDRGERVVLVRHSYLPGWHLPGGAVNRRESLTAAVRREVWEETGLRLDGALHLQSLHFRVWHGASDHIAVFVARDWSGTLRVRGLEIVEAGFFALDALPADTSPGTRRRLSEYRGQAPVAEAW